MQNILITGATGLIGSRIVELLQSDFHFIPLSSKDADITDRNSVDAFMNSVSYDYVLHLAGYTQVDQAEIEKEKAHAVNVIGTKNIYDAAQKMGKNVIYISTDFVFDGTNPPYDETSTPHPVGYYGQSKYDGELVVKDRAAIVRISYPYRATYDKRSDFVRTIASLLRSGKTIKAVRDASFTPTFIDDIAYGLKHILNHYSPEIYHLVGSQTLSQYDAAIKIAHTYNLDTSLVQPTTYDDYFKGKAPRPRYGEIKSIKNTFQPMKSFEEGLHEVALQTSLT